MAYIDSVGKHSHDLGKLAVNLCCKYQIWLLKCIISTGNIEAVSTN